MSISSKFRWQFQVYEGGFVSNLVLKYNYITDKNCFELTFKAENGNFKLSQNLTEKNNIEDDFSVEKKKCKYYIFKKKVFHLFSCISKTI